MYGKIIFERALAMKHFARLIRTIYVLKCEGLHTSNVVQTNLIQAMDQEQAFWPPVHSWGMNGTMIISLAKCRK